MSGNGNNIAATFKALIEKLRPNLDHYRKLPRKARVTRVNRSGDLRTLDLVILLNNGRPDESEPALAKVPLTGGLVPKDGAVVVLEFFRGDPASPFVSDVLNLGQDNLSEVLFMADGGRRFQVDTDGIAWAEVAAWRWRNVP